MDIHKPSRINQAFADAYNNRDIAAALSLYHKDAYLGQLDGNHATGHEAIRRELEHLHSLGGHMESKNVLTVIQGDTALLRAHWVIETEKDGESVVIRGASAEVARKQPNGLWLYIIDQPLGSV